MSGSRARAGLVGVVVAGLVLASLVGRLPTRPTPRRIPTIEVGERAPDEPVSLVDDLWSWDHQREPVGGRVLRPVVVRAVHRVDRLEIEGDRGREIVRVDRMGGPDPRLPIEVGRYLEGEGRAALAAWLTEPGTRLFEVTPAYEQGRDAYAMPHWPDAAGARVVLLRRFGWDDPVGEDVARHALEEGWTYPSEALGDVLALDPRLPFRDAEHERGVMGLASVRAMRRAYADEAAQLEALSPAAFQRLGERLVDEVERWMGWRPARPLTFVKTTPEPAFETFVGIFEEWIEAMHAAARVQARRYRERARADGRDVEVSIEVTTPPAEALARDALDSHGLSPAGPRIWFVGRGQVAPTLIEPLLVHEIMHQYQEEVLYPDGPFPPFQLAARATEAHAELLGAAWTRADRGLGPDYHGIDYLAWVRDLEAILEALGLEPDEAARRLHEETWSFELWNRLASGEIGVQEWLFRQERVAAFAGLRFEPEADARGRPGARVTNTSGRTFHGQLVGSWLWWEAWDGEPVLTELARGPVNLVLPAGASVHLVVHHEPLWRDGPPVEAICGLVSPTPWPVAD